MKRTLSLESKETVMPGITRVRVWSLSSVLSAAAVLLALVFVSSGCGFYHEPGQTAAEQGRRYRRVVRVNTSELVEDIDKVLMLDQPSHLTDKRIP